VKITKRVLELSFALCAVISLCGPCAAVASTPNPVNKARLESTVRYLQDVQDPEGGFGNGGEPPSQDFSAWVAFALAADGVNPQDQAQPNGVDAYTFLLTHADRALPNEICKPVICTTAFERELLVVDAAGTNPHQFAGFDLVGEILARQLPDGSFPFVPGGQGEVNDTIFAILALSLIREPAAQAAVEHATGWLIAAQGLDGSWPAQRPKLERGEVDMTGAAIEALNAAGLHNTHAEQKAIEYLHKAQEPDGGFPEFPEEGESNVASTAWAVQGIWSTGGNAELWLKGSGLEPLSYMASLQQPDGHIKWRKSQDVNGVWMTAYVAPAFAGQALPVPPVPRAVKSDPVAPSTAAAPSAAAGAVETGNGGLSAQKGAGVIAGGGGRGAPLFSRPLAQSQGSTPGGARLLSGTPSHPARHNGKLHALPKDRHARRSEPPTIMSASTGMAHRSDPKEQAPAAHAGSHSLNGTLITGQAPKAQPAGGDLVKGVLIGAPGAIPEHEALEAGAPGLQSARAGGNQTPWLALAIATGLLLGALLGAQHESRRPQVIL
jgi:hypothetical protein